MKSISLASNAKNADFLCILKAHTKMMNTSIAFPRDTYYILIEYLQVTYLSNIVLCFKS